MIFRLKQILLGILSYAEVRNNKKATFETGILKFEELFQSSRKIYSKGCPKTLRVVLNIVMENGLLWGHGENIDNMQQTEN